MKKFLSFLVDFLIFFFTFVISDWFTQQILGNEKWYIHLAVYMIVYIVIQLIIKLVEKAIDKIKKK